MTEEQRRDFVEIIDEESDRLNRLIGEAVEMARLDAKEVKLELGPHRIPEPIDLALEESRNVNGNHEVRNGRLITSVTDRGMGIDDLERSMIFDKF